MISKSEKRRILRLRLSSLETRSGLRISDRICMRKTLRKELGTYDLDLTPKELEKLREEI